MDIHLHYKIDNIPHGEYYKIEKHIYSIYKKESVYSYENIKMNKKELSHLLRRLMDTPYNFPGMSYQIHCDNNIVDKSNYYILKNKLSHKDSYTNIVDELEQLYKYLLWKRSGQIEDKYRL